MKLTITIWNNILNYEDTVHAISAMNDDEVSFLKNIFPGDCKNSSDRDRHIKNMVTGDKLVRHESTQSRHESARVNTSQLDQEIIIVCGNLVGKVC